MREEKRPQRRVLLVEDDEEVMEILEEMIGRYAGEVAAVKAVNAEEALRVLRSQKRLGRIDAMVLDLMMPYGRSAKELGGENDPEMNDTGVNLLAKLRQDEAAGGNDLWVAVVTARIQHSILREVEDLIGDRGQLYLKPFPTYLLQHHLALALGVDSRVPEELLP